jgi:hypothetical protein
MYKFANLENTLVTNLTTGVTNIGPSVSHWEGYQAWLADGGVTQPFMTVDEIKSMVWEKIKAERDQRKNGGFKVGDKWFHSDTESRIQQIGLVMAGAAVPAVPWKTMDGSFQTMSQALAGQIFQSAFALDSALFQKAEQHKALMEGSPDPLNYDYSTGWPENYFGL